MVMNAFGGFAGGLAQGLNNGIQMSNQMQSLKLQERRLNQMDRADERDAEVHEMQKDKFASEKDVRDRRNKALAQIAEYHTNAFAQNNQPAPGTANMQQPAAPSFGAPPEQQTPSNIKLAGPIPQGGLAMNAPAPFAADNPAGALAPAQPAQQQEQTPPAKVLERGMVTGMYTPKMLTDIAGIFAQNGLHEEGIKYMNQAYEFEKRGGVRAGMALMQNNPGAAAEAMANSGIDLEGLPVKVKPDDPNDMNWKINVKGQGEKTINARDVIQSNMDPEKFFELEDKRRQREMDERKQANVERKTDAEIGFFRSRSNLADTKAENPSGAGGLRASRSTEAQINTAIKRRDTSFDRVSSVRNEEGKFEVDPIKRQELDSRANQYLTFLEDQRGEELDSREHHKFTDVMLSYPVGGTPQQIEQWQQKEFLPRFGIRRKARNGSDSSGSLAGNIDLNNRPTVKNSDGSISTVRSMSFNEDGKEVLIPTIRDDGKVMSEDEAVAHYRKTGKHLGKFSTPEEATAYAKTLSSNQGKQYGGGTKPGSLAALKERERARSAASSEMAAVQKALQAPNLNTEQRKTLSLKAQEIATRRDALK